jgi:hypothetical protein
MTGHLNDPVFVPATPGCNFGCCSSISLPKFNLELSKKIPYCGQFAVFAHYVQYYKNKAGILKINLNSLHVFLRVTIVKLSKVLLRYNRMMSFLEFRQSVRASSPCTSKVYIQPLVVRSVNWQWCVHLKAVSGIKRTIIAFSAIRSTSLWRSKRLLKYKF